MTSTDQYIGTPPKRNLFGNPVWYHHHGDKMKISDFDKGKRRLVIAGSAASVTIEPCYQGNTEWLVEWKVVQFKPTGEVVNGFRRFTPKQLAVAFGVEIESVATHSEWLIDLYGGECAEQGKYIRWKTWLNIPCPGTSHDGDPNVSIGLDDEITEAVRWLLSLEPSAS